MKTLDVLGTGVKVAKNAAKAIAAKVVPVAPVVSREAREELERRAAINARGAALRAEREAQVAQLFGENRWVPRRPGWLDWRGR